jgi:hypothetical protein
MIKVEYSSSSSYEEKATSKGASSASITSSSLRDRKKGSQTNETLQNDHNRLENNNR